MRPSTRPCNPSTDPGHRLWLSLFSAVPQQQPKLNKPPQCGAYSSSAGRAHLGKAKSCSQAREFCIWNTTNLLSFLDEVRKHIQEELPIFLGKSMQPWVRAHSDTAAHKHVLAAQCGCAQRQSAAEHAQATAITVFNKGISHHFCSGSIAEQKQRVHSNMGCTELLSWCVPQQHPTQVAIAGSWTATRETPGLQGLL